MPRRREAQKREIAPDPIYQSQLVTKFINSLMSDGKRSIAQSIFYDAMDVIRDRGHEDPMKVFKRALDNVRPVVEVKSRRVGGATYQVPVEVRPERRQSLAIRWMIAFGRQRPEKTMKDKLAGELLDAFNERGGAVKKREDVHRMAEANKAFAHYRF